MIALEPATYFPDMRRMVGPHGEARLSPSEHTVLMRLAQRRGTLVASDALIGALWEPDNEPETAARLHAGAYLPPAGEAETCWRDREDR